MTVPASIGDAIARRLAGLGAGVQRIIEQAAVLGETFDLQALIATSQTDLAATLAAVDSAEGVGLIRAVPGSDGEFSFVHALTREAVIGRMAASQLRIMHARAAEALEGRADPSVVPRLANHYLLAHVLGYHDAGVAIRPGGGADGRTQPRLRGRGEMVRAGGVASGARPRGSSENAPRCGFQPCTRR